MRGGEKLLSFSNLLSTAALSISVFSAYISYGIYRASQPKILLQWRVVQFPQFRNDEISAEVDVFLINPASSAVVVQEILTWSFGDPVEIYTSSGRYEGRPISIPSGGSTSVTLKRSDKVFDSRLWEDTVNQFTPLRTYQWIEHNQQSEPPFTIYDDAREEIILESFISKGGRFSYKDALAKVEPASTFIEPVIDEPCGEESIDWPIVCFTIGVQGVDFVPQWQNRGFGYRLVEYSETSAIVGRGTLLFDLPEMNVVIFE